MGNVIKRLNVLLAENPPTLVTIAKVADLLRDENNHQRIIAYPLFAKWCGDHKDLIVGKMHIWSELTKSGG